MKALLLLLCAASAWPASAAAPAAASADGVVALAALPAGWTAAPRDEALDRREKVSAVALVGARRYGLAARIIVSVYGPGSPLAASAEDYLARQRDPGAVPLEGEKTGPLEATALAGKDGRRFVRQTLRPSPGPRAKAREVSVTEEIFAADLPGGRVLALTLSAPEPLYRRSRAAFLAVSRGLSLRLSTTKE